MKKYFLVPYAFTMLMVALISCVSGELSQQAIKGDKKVETQNREVGSFESISSYGSFNVYVSYANKTEVKVEAESNLLPYIETSVESNKLIIKPVEGSSLNSNYPITVYVKSPYCKQSQLFGSGNMKVDGFTSDEISFEIKGSGNISAENIKIGQLKCSIAGSGDIKASGNVENSHVNIAGSGSVYLDKVMSKTSTISIAGSGSAHVWVSERLNSKISGSGDIYYKGNPSEVENTVFGSGKIKKL